MTFKFSYCLYSMWDIMSLNVGIGNSPLGMDCHIHIVDGVAAYDGSHGGQKKIIYVCGGGSL